jgi:hypothetical protein
MYHHITRQIAEARTADVQRTQPRRTSTVSSRLRQRLRTLALAVAATAALAPAGALAQPAQDDTGLANSPTDSVHHDHIRSATGQSITFTNPLHRSRGRGAGAGLL